MMITTSHLNDHNDGHNDGHDDSHEYHSSNRSINDNRSSSSAARCRARDATLLEPLVWFFFSLSFSFYLKFILGPLNTSKHRWQQ